ncbi:16S rRNA (cytosine(1402)-N(4))-methyltransferase RsmH [Candidatus Amesbacteria bacterium]|nr:16S rRNA (cytosine(1402)-N(4))-methyltransferase RsmH [Candidatus Amesbacteria bacterium]
MSSYHTPVLLESAVNCLNVRKDRKYIDATLGGGGHSALIRSRGGMVLGIDQDQDAIDNSKKCADIVVKSNFVHLEEIVAKYNWFPVSGVLLDLGMSMHQIVDSKRGFSFQAEEPLDMRMGESAVTAAELVNQLTVGQLASILKDFGEIPGARSLASKIVANRTYSTTGQLAKVCGKWSQQAFQALRIAVNDELGALTQVIPQIKNILEVGGRAVIISFHSLEDRIVKNEFENWGLPLTKKSIQGERRSKLRAFEKI